MSFPSSGRRLSSDHGSFASASSSRPLQSSGSVLVSPSSRIDDYFHPSKRRRTELSSSKPTCNSSNSKLREDPTRRLGRILITNNTAMEHRSHCNPPLSSAQNPPVDDRWKSNLDARLLKAGTDKSTSIDLTLQDEVAQGHMLRDIPTSNTHVTEKTASSSSSTPNNVKARPQREADTREALPSRSSIDSEIDNRTFEPPPSVVKFQDSFFKSKARSCCTSCKGRGYIAGSPTRTTIPHKNIHEVHTVNDGYSSRTMSPETEKSVVSKEESKRREETMTREEEKNGTVEVEEKIRKLSVNLEEVKIDGKDAERKEASLNSLTRPGRETKKSGVNPRALVDLTIDLTDMEDEADSFAEPRETSPLFDLPEEDGEDEEDEADQEDQEDQEIEEDEEEDAEEDEYNRSLARSFQEQILPQAPHRNPSPPPPYEIDESSTRHPRSFFGGLSFAISTPSTSNPLGLGKIMSSTPAVHQPKPRKPAIKATAARPPPIDVSSHKKIPFIMHLGAKFNDGMNVEIADEAVLLDGTPLFCGNFMRIHSFTRDEKTGKEYAHGELFVRTREMGGILPKQAGEVILLRDRCAVAVDAIVCKRRLIKTNRLPPACREPGAWLDVNNVEIGKDRVERVVPKPKLKAFDPHHGLLICRWKGEINNNVAGTTGKTRWGETGSIVRLTELEADESYACTDAEVMEEWKALGRTKSSLSSPPAASSRKDLSPRNAQTQSRLANSSQNKRAFSEMDTVGSSSYCTSKLRAITDAEGHVSKIEKEEERRTPFSSSMIFTVADEAGAAKAYSYGDLFCGGGGVSQGARQAGLKILYGVDNNSHAIETWRLNHGMRKGHHVDVNEFLSNDARFGHMRRVDILHMSPPCQTFSPAHTVRGQNDEANTASFLCITAALDLCRPRAATCEETNGLLTMQDSEFGRLFMRENFSYFAALIHSFTSQNYSVRWKVLDGRDFGVCCKRMRLILIASCPGETPARFPIRTHTTSKNPYTKCDRTGRLLLRTPTIGEVISGIPRNVSHHDTTLNNARPTDERISLDNHYDSTICTGGSSEKWQNHPNGKRKFTARELACIMSFPREYLFSTNSSVTAVTKIIGNAVPPSLAEANFRSVIKHLRVMDAPKRQKRRPDGRGNDAVQNRRLPNAGRRNEDQDGNPERPFLL